MFIARDCTGSHSYNVDVHFINTVITTFRLSRVFRLREKFLTIDDNWNDIFGAI
jgi:hypothetical protein